MMRRLVTATVGAAAYVALLVCFLGLDQATSLAQQAAFLAIGLSVCAGMTVFFIATHESQEER